MARPQGHTAEEFVDAAIAIVDAEGLEALTFRRLGAEMGVSYTTVYTYFENREQLVAALVNKMTQDIIREVNPTGDSPHEVILAIGIAARRALAMHPLLVPAFASVSTDVGEADNGATMVVVNQLERAGLAGPEIPRAYRAIESYVFGAAIFDFGAAPRHLSIRRRRYRRTGHPEFMEVSRSDRVVELHNEESFTFGLDRLLAALGI
jgi:AcrR family transcriptional regulator